jgi:hypothetical protein
VPTSPPTASPTVAGGVEVEFASTQVTFATLSITAFDDPAFDARFRSQYKAQVAASAGVSSVDVVIESIAAGSVVVACTVFFPLGATRAAAQFQVTMLDR